ncbi:MAG: peptidylprolyl isomerase [Burkholderiaceae bacterium]
MNSMRFRTSFFATALIALFAFGPSLAAAQNVAVVNNKPIPKAKADAVVEQLKKQGQQDTPDLQNAVREDLIRREILVQEAEKKGLPVDPEVQGQLERARQQVLIGALAQDYFKANPPTDTEVRQQYDLYVKESGGKEYKARHILVEKEADAKAIIAKLKTGAKFEELAKQSKDPGSAANGGDLDWAPASTYVKEFADALTKLPKGQYTQTPVKTQFGYHVIRLDDTRDAKVPSFQEAKPQITAAMMANQQWQQGKFEAMLKDLRDKAKVE